MLQIIATVEDLGAISEDMERRQTIELKDVAVMSGEYCAGKTRHIVFLSPAESKRFDDLIDSIKDK